MTSASPVEVRLERRVYWLGDVVRGAAVIGGEIDSRNREARAELVWTDDSIDDTTGRDRVLASVPLAEGTEDLRGTFPFELPLPPEGPCSSGAGGKGEWGVRASLYGKGAADRRDRGGSQASEPKALASLRAVVLEGQRRGGANAPIEAYPPASAFVERASAPPLF